MIPTSVSMALKNFSDSIYKEIYIHILKLFHFIRILQDQKVVWMEESSLQQSFAAAMFLCHSSYNVI